MTHSVEIDPTQLAAIRAEVQTMLDAVRGVVTEGAAHATDEHGRTEPYAAGRRDGVTLAEAAVHKALDIIARYGRADLSD